MTRRNSSSPSRLFSMYISLFLLLSPETPSRKTLISSLVWVFGMAMSGVLILGLTGCNQGGKMGAMGMGGPGGARPAVPVVADIVKQQDIQLYITVEGETKASEDVQVPARVTGFLQKMFFEPGAIVQQGTPLFEIDPAEYQAAMDMAQAEFEINKASEQLAKGNVERSRTLIESRAVSEQDFQTLVAEQQRSEASTRRSEAAMAKAKIDLGYTHITAPITGKTSWNFVDVGNLVGPQSGNSTILTTIAQMDPIFVYFKISDSDLNVFFLRDSNMAKELNHEQSQNPNQNNGGKENGVSNVMMNGTKHPFRMTLLSSRNLTGQTEFSFDGIITLIDNRIRSTTGQITLRGEIPNPEYRITPGQICSVRIPTELVKNAVVVREEAVLTDLTLKYVYVLNEENKVERRDVTIGSLENHYRIITSGLKPGEKYVVKGTQKVAPGAEVAPQMMEN